MIIVLWVTTAPGEFLLRAAVTGDIDGQHELPTSSKIGQ